MSLGARRTELMALVKYLSTHHSPHLISSTPPSGHIEAGQQSRQPQRSLYAAGPTAPGAHDHANVRPVSHSLSTPASVTCTQPTASLTFEPDHAAGGTVSISNGTVNELLTMHTQMDGLMLGQPAPQLQVPLWAARCHTGGASWFSSCRPANADLMMLDSLGDLTGPWVDAGLAPGSVRGRDGALCCDFVADAGTVT